jgi:hypothetical protein
VLLPAAAGVAILAAGGGGASVPLFLVAGLLGFVFYLYRQQLALVGRLLSVASHALVDNPSIVGGSLLLQAGGAPVSGSCAALQWHFVTIGALAVKFIP